MLGCCATVSVSPMPRIPTAKIVSYRWLVCSRKVASAELNAPPEYDPPEKMQRAEKSKREVTSRASEREV